MRCTRHRRYLTLLGLTIGIALVLTSCFGGDDENDDSTTTTQASTSPPPPPTAVETPTTTQVIVVETATTTQPIVVETATTTQPIVADTATTIPRDPAVPLIYTVQPGDTLFSIARQFGVSVDELIELNNIANPDVIYVDDTLTIPPPG